MLNIFVYQLIWRCFRFWTFKSVPFVWWHMPPKLSMMNVLKNIMNVFLCGIFSYSKKNAIDFCFNCFGILHDFLQYFLINSNKNVLNIAVHVMETQFMPSYICNESATSLTAYVFVWRRWLPDEPLCSMHFEWFHYSTMQSNFNTIITIDHIIESIGIVWWITVVELITWIWCWFIRCRIGRWWWWWRCWHWKFFRLFG